MRTGLWILSLLLTCNVTASAQVDTGTSPAVELNIRPGERGADPGAIVVDAQYRDSSGNNLLDAGEEGSLTVSLTNRGEQGVTPVFLSLRLDTPIKPPRIGPERERLQAGSFVQVARLQALPSGTTKQTTLSLHAPSTLLKENLALTLQAVGEGNTRLGNRTSISIPLGESTTVSVVDRRIPRTTANRPDAIAVVIGNKEYQHPDIPDIDYAARDAEVMRKYLLRTLGFRRENIIYVENASRSAISRIFGTDSDPEGKLYNWIKPEQSEVFVYYSGHGAPSPKSGNAYLIPTDADPNYLSQNGYLAQQLYENLASLPAKSVTVVLEACFSGISESGAIVQDASPVELSVENPVLAMENGLAFTAGTADQIASWYPEKKHGMFTYFFLKGLRGAADRNGDRAVTAGEMESYVTGEVPYRARRRYNREQTPQVVGQDKDRVLVRYEGRTPSN